MLAEWKNNSEILAEVRRCVKANKQNPEIPRFVTRRFGSAAVQLLATERYVDEDKLFFKLANNCVMWALALNEQLNCWSSEQEVTEAWLSESDKGLVGVIKQLRKEVTRVRNALGKRF